MTLKYVLSLLFLLSFIHSLQAQVILNVVAGGGLADMKGAGHGYSHTRFPGPRIHAGAKVDGPIHWIDGLSWETGLQYTFNKAGYYLFKRKEGQNTYYGERRELDKSVKLYDRIHTLALPVRLKYNAFSFLGILAGIQVSYTLKGDMYDSSNDRIFSEGERLHYYPLVPMAEAGLFAPIGEKFEVSASVVKGLSDRFYSSIDANGDPMTQTQYYDLGFTVSLSYKVFPGKKSNSK